MKKALALEQMDALIKWGVPTEKANRGYERSLIPVEDLAEHPLNVKPGHPGYVWSDWKPTKFYRKWDNNPRVESRPAFNMENLLDFLPTKVDVNFTLQMGVDRDGSWYARYHTGLNAEADNLLDALYKLLVLCIEQKKCASGK